MNGINGKTAELSLGFMIGPGAGLSKTHAVIETPLMKFPPKSSSRAIANKDGPEE